MRIDDQRAPARGVRGADHVVDARLDELLDHDVDRQLDGVALVARAVAARRDRDHRAVGRREEGRVARLRRELRVGDALVAAAADDALLTGQQRGVREHAGGLPGGRCVARLRERRGLLEARALGGRGLRLDHHRGRDVLEPAVVELAVGAVFRLRRDGPVSETRLGKASLGAEHGHRDLLGAHADDGPEHRGGVADGVVDEAHVLARGQLLGGLAVEVERIAVERAQVDRERDVADDIDAHAADDRRRDVAVRAHALLLGQEVRRADDAGRTAALARRAQEADLVLVHRLLDHDVARELGELRVAQFGRHAVDDGQGAQRRRHAAEVGGRGIAVQDAGDDRVPRLAEDRGDQRREVADRIGRDVVALARLAGGATLGDRLIALDGVDVEVAHIDVQRAAEGVEREGAAEPVEDHAARQRVGDRPLLREAAALILHRADELLARVDLELDHAGGDAGDAERGTRDKNARPS